MAFPLQSLTAIAVSGADTQSFLHGQLTADVVALQSGSVVPTAWCEHKGRVLAVMLLCRLDTARFFLVLPSFAAEAIETRLARYVMRSDVRLERFESAAGLSESDGVAGPLANAPSDSAIVGFDAVAQQFAVQRPASTPVTWLFSAERVAMPDTAEDDATWLRSEIDLGIPWLLHDDLSEAFLPQMLGLDTLGGLSYQKGCYPGQEVVARLHYRGELKRSTWRAASDQAVAPGERIQDADGKNVGTVLYSVAGDSSQQVLAVVDVDTSGELKLSGRRPISLTESISERP